MDNFLVGIKGDEPDDIMRCTKLLIDTGRYTSTGLKPGCVPSTESFTKPDFSVGSGGFTKGMSKQDVEADVRRIIGDLARRVTVDAQPTANEPYFYG